MELVGLIPAAGLAKRLGAISSSKEILPLRLGGESKGNEPKVFSEYLLGMYKMAKVNQVHFIIRKGKWDIPEYYGNGSGVGLPMSYLIMQYPHGVPFTLNEAYPFIKDKLVALGFPDMIVTPTNAYSIILEKLRKSQADVVLGVFPIETKEKWDMVELNSEGKIKDIWIKQKGMDLKYGWSIAVWKPSFSQFMHDKVEDIIREGGDGKIQIGENEFRELYPGDLFREAIRGGLKIESVIFEEGKCMDLGTVEDLERFRNTPGF